MSVPKLARIPFRGAAILGACLAANLVHCDNVEKRDSSLPEVVYGGIASDEAFERLWPKIPTAEVSASKGAMIIAPAAGATLSGALPSSFTWAAHASARPAARPQLAEMKVRDPRQTLSFSLDGASIDFGLGAAEAHLPPVSGNIFLLELSLPGSDAPIRILTTELSWTPDPTSWSRMRSAGGPISARLYNAYLRDNILEEGPYTRGDTVSFSVAPE